MIRVAIKQGLLGESGTEWHDVPWREGVTVADLTDQLGAVVPVHVSVGVDGVELEPGDEIPDGATVVLCGTPGYWVIPYVVQAVIAAVVGLAVNYLASLLSPSPTSKPPGVPQERGDNASPTYAWDQIQTSYGQGLIVPVVLGRHAVGGQSISAAVIGNSSPTQRPGDTSLETVFALCEGPVTRIGLVAGNRNRLGEVITNVSWVPLPQIWLNDNLQDQSGTVDPGVLAYTRTGTLHQSSIPQVLGSASGVSASYIQNVPLLDTNDEHIFTYNSTNELSTIGILIYAPSGCYETVAATGALINYPVRLAYSWRYLNETSWRSFGFPIYGSNQYFNSSASVLTGGGTRHVYAWFQGAGGAHINGPVQIRVKRWTARGSVTSVVSHLVLQSINIVNAGDFAHPGVALLALTIQASATNSGALPRLKVAVDGSSVRVWSPTNGFSNPTWDVPTGTFGHGHTLPPGRNPAWQLGELATNTRWGMGLSDDDVDWPALARWAAFCNRYPAGGWTDNAHACDYVIDESRPAWEIILTICQAGRAAPIWRGGKLSVSYQYRDAHSDSSVSVPAKTSVQLINSALCSDVQVRWLEKQGRATSFDFQYLDEEQAYSQIVLSLEDVGATINDPTDPNSEQFLPQVQQAYGVTRRKQLVRQGYYQHRQSRLIRRELTFNCGPWLLAAEVGDLIDFQHDILRPFDASVATAAMTYAATTAANDLFVDHNVPNGSAVAFRDSNSVPVYRTVTASVATTNPNTQRAGSQITIGGAAVTVGAGAAVVYGTADELVQTYQVVSVSLGQDMRRQVRALQWVPEVFDEVPVAAGEKGDVPELITPAAQDAVAQASQITIDRNQAGRLVVAWQVSHDRSGEVARVHVRAPQTNDDWSLVGETPTTSLELPTNVGWQSIDVAVVIATTAGAFGPPGAGGVALAQLVDEWPRAPMPAPTDFRARTIGDRVDLDWQPIEGGDVEGYELRSGRYWSSGRTLYRGEAPHAVLVPAPGFDWLQVCAVHRSGLHGERATLQHAVAGVPSPGAATVGEVEYAPTHAAGATLSGCKWNPPYLQHDDTANVGTITSAEIDLGFAAPWFLRVVIETREVDGRTVDEATSACASGAALWSTVDAREASPALPGANWRVVVDDLTAPINSADESALASGLRRGQPGRHVEALVESRTYAAGAWGAWREHDDRATVCQKWQARVVLSRTTTARDFRVTTLRLLALA